MTYPIKEIDRGVWTKKVNCTSMYTIPAEDQALPVLQEIEEILLRLLHYPLEETLDQNVVEYFFVNVFPVVCQKVIRSRYFKSHIVLKFANSVLENSVYLVQKYLDVGVKYPKFLEVLIIVFSTDQFYFKNNNQITFYENPSLYFKFKNDFGQNLKVGDFVDVIKTSNLTDKICWSRGEVIEVDDDELRIAYLYDCSNKKVILKNTSPQLAPFQSKTKDFQWRLNLKVGDIVDFQDQFSSWYNSTVVKVIEKDDGKRLIKITMKVYHENGPKTDENGKFFGFLDYEQTVDATSPKLQPYCSMAKEHSYQSSKSSYDSIDDSNDCEFQEICGQKIYALPRKKHLSQFMFKTINTFGQMNGFEKIIQFLDKQINFDVLCFFVKGVSGVTAYLHKNFIKDLVPKLKKIIEKHIFEEPQKMTKFFTKQKSQMIFSGLRTLQKRIYTNDIVYEYENLIKMKLVDSCLQSEALKKKLQGLNELKDIVRTVSYTTEKSRRIKVWIKENKIFEKIYIVNSHVQLIKKSEEFFKFVINENILEVTDLERLYKMAQKGDYQSRISLYKLFQDVSHIFKKQHVEYLIDTILESQLNLILNEDIDLLHELSRFSNYFPLKKVINFFETIILGENKVKELNDYAIKKYSEIVARNFDMKAHRIDIIRSFLARLTTHDITQVTKVLKGIFEGIGIGEWGKKELNDILSEENVNEISIQAIKSHKNKPEFDKIATKILDFLLSIYKLSFRVKIKVQTLISIWNQLSGNEEKEYEFYQWANNVLKCDQGLDDEGINEEFENFYRKLFSKEKIKSMKDHQFELAKNLFVEINKKNKIFSVSNTMKDRQITKQYKLKVPMNEVKLIDVLMEIIFFAQDGNVSDLGLNFFMEFYTSKDNSHEQIQEFLDKLLKQLKEYFVAKDEKKIQMTLKLIEILIDDSEKNNESYVDSLLSKKHAQKVKFLIINELSYASDSVKKAHLQFPLNITLMNMRKLLSKQFNVPYKQIKIVASKELKDHQNSRTLEELKLNPNQPLTLSRRVISSYQEIQLMPGDKMNPKAARCFKVIFDKYSTNGLMDKDQCNSFTAVCLGSHSTTKYYAEKISSLYNTYDEDKDGFLVFDQFLRFYEDAARDRPSTVWSNLRSHGVKSNLRFIDEIEEDENSPTIFPRKIMSQSPELYNILFELLKIDSLAPLSLELLERLPIYKEMEEEFLSIKTEDELKSNMNFSDPFSYFYKLSIIDTLLHGAQMKQQNQQKKWKKKFIECHGYEILFEVIQNLLKHESFSIEIEIYKQILLAAFSSLIEFWIQCFAKSEKVSESLTLLTSDFDIDEKIEYLVTGSFPKKQQKLNIQNIKIQEEISWKGIERKQLESVLIDLLKMLWEKSSDEVNVKKESVNYSSELLIDQMFFCLNILFLDENPQKLSKTLSQLLEKITLSRMVTKIYTVILCLCFYSQQKYQGIYIKEMFKNLTKSSITFQHFRVLAVLVSKFGISGSGEESSSSRSIEVEEEGKMRQVLLDNVLKNSNELTVEGCAKLLCNLNLENLPIESFYDIWEERLFNPATICKKEQTKAILYDLIIKIAQSNPQYIDEILSTVQDTIEEKSRKMKITYCSEFKERSATTFVGLKNLGNICYMNSMIQQMFMNKTFRYLIMRINDHKPPENIEVTEKEVQRTVDDNLLHQIQRIFAYLEKTNRIDFTPKDFCVAYKPFGESVNIMIQQDVQEFVSMFFDRLQSCIESSPLKKVVQNFYSGLTANLFTCHECKKTKKVEETFHSITLEVKNSKNLTDSFNRYILGELISDYTCDFCVKKVDVTKRTRISRTPKILIIHLQRIVFNLDTFINEKITSKHQFPHDFNLHPYTLDYFDRSEAGETEIKPDANLDYSLIGIICHTGNADSGHYISYIKTQNNKWFEFNDSLINVFNPNNIESECFGGYFSTYDDDYDWDRKESSKSAYLLLYEKQGSNTIELILKQLKEKEATLKELSLEEIVMEKKEEMIEEKNEENPTESPEESSQIPDDSEKEAKELLAQKQLQIIRSKSEDNIQTSKEQIMMKKENDQVSVKVKDSISPYIPQQLVEEVQADNIIHFLEKSLSSSSFSQFFAKLVSLEHEQHKSLLPLCQSLTFGFWLKSPSFKMLLSMIDNLISHYPQGFTKIILENPSIITLLIEYSEAQVRTNMASFLAKTISDVIEKQNLDLESDSESNRAILKFLDHLFDLLPSTVSKCWTKFSNYFEFWYQFSTKGPVQVKYMLKKQIIKHFMDYFLDTKSPLKIYVTKREHSIGSVYTNPNFGTLLKCVSSLVEKSVYEEKRKLTKEEQILLVSCESIDKLIIEKYEFIATKFVREVCPNNLAASEKVAYVILKGLNKLNYETIQPYLEVLHDFILINDQYHDLRVKWVLGKETLALSTYYKKILALNSYSFDERLYNYDSTLYIEGGTSLLQLLFNYYKKMQNFSTLCLKQLLRLCLQRQDVRKFVFNLSAPTLAFSKYSDFFKGFINRYLQDAKRGYVLYSVAGFNKEELGKSVKQIYEKIEEKLIEEREEIEKKNKIEKQKERSRKKIEKEKSAQKEPQEEKKQKQEEKEEVKEEEKKEEEQSAKKEVQKVEEKVNNSDNEEEGEKDQLKSKENQDPKDNENYQIKIVEPENDKNFMEFSSSEEEPFVKNQTSNSQYPMTWHPIQFQYQTTQAQEKDGLIINRHESLVTYLLTKPTGFSNRSFSTASSIQKLTERIEPKTWENQKTETVKGFFIKNQTRQMYRIQTDEGCFICRANDSIWVWSSQIIKTWVTERTGDWPKVTLYTDEQK